LYTCTAQIASAKGPSAQQGSRPRGDAALRQPRAHTSQGASGGQRLRRCACPAPLGALNFFELGPATVTHEVPALVQGPRMAAEHGDGGRGAQPDRRVRSPRNPGATALIRSSPDRKRQPLQRACIRDFAQDVGRGHLVSCREFAEAEAGFYVSFGDSVTQSVLL
jgi:hypothetical protein